MWLGTYSKNWNNRDEVHGVFFDINDKLREYLKSVSAISEEKIDQYQNVFKKDLITLLKKMTENKYRQINSHVKISSTVTINFIIFNYTFTVETLLGLKNRSEKGNMLQRINDFHYTEVNRLYHIHADLDSEELILGVNDSSQLANESFQEDVTIESMLVKPTTTYLKEDMIDSACEQLINKSDIICLYGCSMGLSDKKWWKLISDHLMNSSSFLLRYSYAKEKPVRITDKVMLEKKLREELEERIKELEGNDASKVYEQIKNKILVLPHYSIFNFKES